MRSKTSRILVACAAIAVLACVTAYAFRNTVATHAMAYMVDHTDKAHCTKPSIDIASSLQEITVGELECTLASGPIRYVHVEGKTTVKLHGLSDLQVHVDKVTTDHRERNVSAVETNTLGDASAIVGMSDLLFKGMLDFAELYSPTVPPIDVDELVMKRAGERNAELHKLHVSKDRDWNRVQAETVQVDGLGDLVSVQALDMRVTPEKGRLNANVFITKPDPGDEPTLTVKVEGQDLSQKHPRISMRI